MQPGGALEKKSNIADQVAHVYRAVAGRALPRGHLQADIDFVAPQTLAGAGTAEHVAVPDAEIIKVR